MEENVEEVDKKRLSPEATILLTVGSVALAIVIYGVVHFFIGG